LILESDLGTLDARDKLRKALSILQRDLEHEKNQTIRKEEQIVKLRQQLKAKDVNITKLKLKVKNVIKKYRNKGTETKPIGKQG
jgi:hypothetical protein